MSFTPSKLFHTVVIAGAALTGCAGATHKPQAPTGANPAKEATNDPNKCPPGSERPYPPCFWIL